MKKYAEAATDARRAVALAPTFGKAHARLGQSLYFLKDYDGAVEAYQEAVRYEPDNPVTRTYLEKARNKRARQLEKAQRKARGDEEISLAEESMPQTVANSIATDPNKGAAVVTSGFRGSSKVLMDAVAQKKPQPQRELPPEVATTQAPPTTPMTAEPAVEDPDFDEALRIQDRANKYLALKQYKSAIEEYSAALFLIPDDPYLSPDLHLGRAHALNGSRRHESACNDAQLAIKIRPTPEAFSTLAKSHFYLKEYQEAIEAFEECQHSLPPGETLTVFDAAYLKKAEAAYREEQEDDNRSIATTRSTRSTKSIVPKLPPPRFVPREQAINSTPNMRSMPKTWPQQSPRTPTALQVGPERTVLFLSESLGIKLNRGADGIVRVLSVTPETPGSPIARDGHIEPGDVVREAAGVDIRRPITNIMWGDTVALVKMAPRPIVLIVAAELSEVPVQVLDERRRQEQRYASGGGGSLPGDSLSPYKSPGRNGIPGDIIREEEEEKREIVSVEGENEI